MNKQFLFGLILSILPLITEAANCPDAAVVVVASVFSTLAVVFIVLGIIAFLLWKRRRGMLYSSVSLIIKHLTKQVILIMTLSLSLSLVSFIYLFYYYLFFSVNFNLHVIRFLICCCSNYLRSLTTTLFIKIYI